MAKSSVKVVFTPSGKRGDFPHGASLLSAARQLGVDLDSVCGGRGLCGRCQVLPMAGAFPKHRLESSPAHLSPFSKAEAPYEERKGRLAPGRRLGCHALLQGDLVIDVPPESQAHRQVIRKEAADVRDFTLAPNLRLCAIEVAQPQLAEPSGDLQRVCQALRQEWGLEATSVHPALLARLQETLREGKWFVTAAVDEGGQLRWLWPGLKEALYGMAIDLGSTTVAGHLCNLASGEVVASASLMNPQIRFGEDLMSRVSYLMMHPEETGELTRVVREALNGLVAEAAQQAGIEAADILEGTLVANPIMHHLCLGLSPVHLGSAPFALATGEALTLPAAALELAVNPAASVYVLPCIAGHVGADAAGMALAEAPHKSDDLTLLVDVGTNAEILLGNRERLLACSSPTGPAFEGAEISCGQRAAPGAIERVRIDRQTLEARFKVIGTDAWSDEPGFSAEATGLCGSGIIEAIAEMFLTGIVSAEGVIQGSLASRTDRLVQQGRTWAYALHPGQPPLLVTQQDVRQIQLAKAALYAGVKLLLARFGAERPARIRLAGAFGSHLDGARALALGLVPDCPLDQVASAGNAAGTGALMALLNREARAEIEAAVQRIEKIETATEPDFQAQFVAAMNFPHSQDPFPQLFAHFPKPPAPAAKPPKRKPR